MISVRSDLADYLQTHNITAVYSFFDTAPNECVALFPYPGGPGIYTKDRRPPASESRRVQVVCRSDTDERAEALADHAYRVLDGSERSLPGYSLVRALAAPFRSQSGADDEGRIAWMFNLEVKQ